MHARVAAMLVLLAVSPVTAPFLTFDFFHASTADAPAASVVVDAKKPHDDKLTSPSLRMAVHASAGSVELPRSTYRRPDFRRRTLPVPLRI